MYFSFCRKLRHSAFLSAICSIAVFWIFGLLLGRYVSACQKDILISSFRAVPYQPVSAVGFLTMVLPVLLSAGVVVLGRPILLLPIVFLKAFVFGFCACACAYSFGSASWLVRSLLLFSDFLSVLVMLWLWVSILSEPVKRRINEFVIAVILILVICLFDYFVISPFTVSLFIQ